jgi:retron-type reverse transcriptase
MEKRKVQINHVLDPLLSRLVKSYVDDEDMRRRIHELFYFLNDGNNGTP